jgi:hypothetical protein
MTRWSVDWGRSNDGFSSALGAAVVEANGEVSRGEVGEEGEERGSSSAGCSSYSPTRRWPRAVETVGGNGGGNGGEAMGRQGSGCGLNAVSTAVLLFGPCALRAGPTRFRIFLNYPNRLKLGN